MKFSWEPVETRLRLVSNPNNPRTDATEGSYRQQLQYLAEYLGWTEDRVRLGITRGYKLTEESADRIAVYFGLHPVELWPEWGRINPTEGMVRCEAEDCDALFAPRRAFHRFCSRSCQSRAYNRTPEQVERRRRYQAEWLRRQRAAMTPEQVERRRQYERVLNDKHRERKREQRRAYYAANREKMRERHRARYAANREVMLAKQKARDAIRRRKVA